ncbi:opacity protein-like surface antigen [Bradyrhizobium japonicum]|jgi:outer membrane immunogenic protein
MKKILLALTAVAAMTGSASAADLAARPYVKAPVPAPVANWTGFYIFGGGGGGGLSNSDQSVQTTVGAVPLTIGQRQGGSGWFGTVGLGYDWQFNSTWVAGVFADGQFGSIRGTVQDPFFGITGSQKLEDSWAAGVRLGYGCSERSLLRQRRLFRRSLRPDQLHDAGRRSRWCPPQQL